MDESLPCLDILEATPEILRRLMAGVTDADARWKPAPERFSIAEVLAHLSHSEGHCYRMRLDRFLSEQRPEFEPDDAQLYLDLYRDADPENAFDHFEEQRETISSSYAACLGRTAAVSRCTGRPGRLHWRR
jgi:hypothetical protein